MMIKAAQKKRLVNAYYKAFNTSIRTAMCMTLQIFSLIFLIARSLAFLFQASALNQWIH